MILSRKSPRAQRYDYSSPGGYFITICTKNHKHYFGKIKGGKMVFSRLGQVCDKEIKKTSELRKLVDIHEYVVMPNHIHLLLIVGEGIENVNEVGTSCCSSVQKNIQLNLNSEKKYKNQKLGSIIGNIKAGITRYAKQNKIPFAWLGRYHDHIIRNEKEYGNIKYYIQNNPISWAEDCFYMKNTHESNYQK